MKMASIVGDESTGRLVAPAVKLIARIVFLVNRYKRPAADERFVNRPHFASARRGADDASEDQYEEAIEPQSVSLHAGGTFADDLDVEILFHDELVIVAGKNSRWARDRKIGLENLIDVQWILPPLETSNSRTVFEAFREHGLPSPKVSMVTFSLHLRTSMLRNGTYVTVLPHSLLQLGGDHLALKALPIKLPKHDFPLAIVTLKNRMLDPVVQLFISRVRDGLKKMTSTQRARQ